MNNQRLTMCLDAKRNIDNIESWLYRATKVWRLRLTMKVRKLLLRTVPYGVLEEKTFDCDKELRQKVLKVVEDHLSKLKEETMIYKYLTPNGRIFAGTVCPFVRRCKRRDERCFEVKAVAFSCGTARLIEGFVEEFMEYEELLCPTMTHCVTVEVVR